MCTVTRCASRPGPYLIHVAARPTREPNTHPTPVGPGAAPQVVSEPGSAATQSTLVRRVLGRRSETIATTTW